MPRVLFYVPVFVPPPVLRVHDFPSLCGRNNESNQATTENSGLRSVEVEVELGGRGGSFLVVRDNGKGMNASDLKDFATYFLTQVRRRMMLADLLLTV